MKIPKKPKININNPQTKNPSYTTQYQQFQQQLYSQKRPKQISPIKNIIKKPNPDKQYINIIPNIPEP